jgi:hypothetical protein
MHDLLQFFGEHWVLTIALFMIVVGGISDVADGRTKLARVIGERNALQAQLAAKGGKKSRADVHTAARMARLLDKVQEADTVVPQLSNTLRAQIDAELEAYNAPVIEAPQKKGRKP